jgi:hypothetical protein
MESRDIHVAIQTDSTPRRHHLGRVLEKRHPIGVIEAASKRAING